MIAHWDFDCTRDLHLYSTIHLNEHSKPLLLNGNLCRPHCGTGIHRSRGIEQLHSAGRAVALRTSASVTSNCNLGINEVTTGCRSCLVAVGEDGMGEDERRDSNRTTTSAKLDVSDMWMHPQFPGLTASRVNVEVEDYLQGNLVWLDLYSLAIVWGGRASTTLTPMAAKMARTWGDRLATSCRITN
jgi:hypothetical protein